MAGNVRCAHCRQENDASFAFCQACGQPMRPERACAACGAALLPGARFCGICGRAAEAPPPTPPPRAAAPQPPTPQRQAPLASPAPHAPSGMEVRKAGVLKLVAVRHDGLPGPTYVVTRAPLHCGRSQGEVLFPDDATVSPRHCRFVNRDGATLVEDLGSVNGTFLRLRQPRALAPGDELRVGRQLLRLEPAARAAAAEGAAHPWGSPDPGYRARLVQLLQDGGTGEVFPLRPGENALGREAGQVSFPGDRYVSARHARLELSEAGVLLTDVGSSNGTFLRLTGATPISAGDQILIGMQLLRVE